MVDFGTMWMDVLEASRVLCEYNDLNVTINVKW